jgi:hypothetical protein
LNGEYAFRAAQVLAFQNAPPDAVREMIETATRASPYSARFQIFKAQYELRQPQPDRAAVEKTYTLILERDPRDVQSRLDFAAALERLEDRPAALAQYREALRYDDAWPLDEPKRLPQKRHADVEKKIEELSRG